MFFCFDSVPIAIGTTALSGEDMYMSAMRGCGIRILHIFKDYLWALGDQSLQPPIVEIKQESCVEATTIENVKEDLEKMKLEINDNKNDQKEEQQSQLNPAEEPEELKLDDELLKNIFFATLKFKSKEIKLPIIVSTFTKLLQDCRYFKLLNFY